MKESEAKIGVRVKLLLSSHAVPKGTKGIIDEDYGEGVMVAWDLPDHKLPKDYIRYDERNKRGLSLLRDGFDKKTGLHLLKKI